MKKKTVVILIIVIQFLIVVCLSIFSILKVVEEHKWMELARECEDKSREQEILWRKTHEKLLIECQNTKTK